MQNLTQKIAHKKKHRRKFPTSSGEQKLHKTMSGCFTVGETPSSKFGETAECPPVEWQIWSDMLFFKFIQRTSTLLWRKWEARRRRICVKRKIRRRPGRTTHQAQGTSPRSDPRARSHGMSGKRPGGIEAKNCFSLPSFVVYLPWMEKG